MKSGAEFQEPYGLEVVIEGKDFPEPPFALRRGGDIAAPDLVDVETVSVLRKRWLSGDLTDEEFRAAIEDLGDLPISRHPALPFMDRAYELRANLTPYDAAYVALAETPGCAFLTADGRLASAPEPHCEVQVLTA
ncbi:MAG: type II toxin-antitoxin system VapC family toxin [Actinomycetota bacterium]|nr:type II toxin-antitoxin system VapC family toxin [Actinomycetota bacterium]MDK1016085.1 type II toxin-antitoxin system VapC family toxin [Actinomycetota bacterium]MDK1025816.1 type II toxin-antitoxin system VapC family toxin [Actinomycetota bacterium]MDK1038274.1 type II toxin-antitoxin system VapC family toxin [Actinomycetota bacterium]MDK1097000.1 type II toxin-antitoxin system VapC family toxin [Actinomycetota bacterium]